MIFSKSDFPHIMWSVLIFLAVLGLGSAAIIASENSLSQAQTKQQDLHRQLNEARKQLATAEEDRDNMKTYTLEYGTLLDRHIFGSDKRLDWIEGLNDIRRQKRVLDFKYAIAPQKIFTPVPALDTGNYDLYLSTMTLQFNLLHEGQLINFFDAMHTNINGWFMMDHCNLERGSLAADPADFSSYTQLKADCSGGWLTLKNRNAK